MRDYDTKNKQLVASWNATKDIRVKREIEDMLVKHNTPFIYKFITKYKHEVYETDDMYNECAKTVIIALRDYDQTLGKSKFISYWSWKMRSALCNYFYWVGKRCVEINDSSIKGKYHSQDGTYGVLADIPVYDEDYEFKINFSDTLDIKSLDDREKDILTKFYALGFNKEQVGESLGLSGERIRQLMQPALDKLYNHYGKESKYTKFVDEFNMLDYKERANFIDKTYGNNL